MDNGPLYGHLSSTIQEIELKTKTFLHKVPYLVHKIIPPPLSSCRDVQDLMKILIYIYTIS